MLRWCHSLFHHQKTGKSFDHDCRMFNKQHFLLHDFMYNAFYQLLPEKEILRTITPNNHPRRVSTLIHAEVTHVYGFLYALLKNMACPMVQDPQMLDQCYIVAPSSVTTHLTRGSRVERENEDRMKMVLKVASQFSWFRALLQQILPTSFQFPHGLTG